MSNHTRTVFLCGKPTQVKKSKLLTTQKEYTNLINHFIEVMISDKNYYLDLFNNNKQSSLIRNLEKTERVHHCLGSAYGQNAVDHAVKELHNHFTRIKNKLYGFCFNKRTELLSYVESIALLNTCIQDLDEIITLYDLISYENAKKKPSTSKLDFYNELLVDMNSFTEEQRKENREEIRAMFYEKLDHWKIPFVKHAPLQLDTRLCTIEKAEDVKADYVLSLKLLHSNERVQIPIKTSKNGLRRLNQYKNGSPTITLKNNIVKVSIPFEKKVKDIKTKNVLGIDMGITDLFYTSQNKPYGTFSGMNTLYEEVLEPKLKKRSSLRNKMRRYQKELKKTTCLLRQNTLKRKIFNMANMLNGKKRLNQCKRKYAHAADMKINEAVKGLFEDVKKQHVLVSMESLDITEFDRGKKANKRDSSWVRGKLVQKFQERLSWHGIPFVEVDPAYTSKACPKCHNINNDNRKFKSFECTVCNHKSDADYNASINIANRAFDKEVFEIIDKYQYSTKKRHNAIKTLYRKKHEDWLIANKKATVAV